MATRRVAPAGFTIMEMLIATIVMMTVTGAIFSLINPANDSYRTQPENADMQQRLRVGVDVLTKDIVMAGAGVYMGASSGSLTNYFAPLVPYRIGDTGDDPAKGVFYRDDTISLMYVPPTSAQTGVNKAMGGGNSQELDVDAQLNCGNDKHDQLCGFENGMRVLIMDVDGTWDYTTITNVQDEALHLQHSDKLSGSYSSGQAVITQIAAHTYYLKTDLATKTYQLMHYDGTPNPDVPIVDNVVKLQFSYYGDPQPPAMIPGKVEADTVGPWTTYGPKPPLLGVNNTSDAWPAGENCTITVSADGQHVPRLPVLAADATGQVLLTKEQLTDGPWCPDANRADRFDADLFRVRKVRIALRVQSALESLRGPAGLLFVRGGTSSSGTHYVPDQEIRFDVTPRNLNLGR